MTLEVYSWWRQSSERDAFEAVRRIHEREHPNVRVENRADPNSVDLRKVVTTRMLTALAPSTFQANLGADLLRWSVVDTNDLTDGSQNLLLPLSRLYTSDDVLVLPEVLLRALRSIPAGMPLAVPMNLHRLNVLYFNRASVAPERLTIEALCPSGQAAPLDFDIAIGLKDPHTLFALAFENVLPALTSAEFYDALFRGEPPTGWEAEVSRALACVQYLSRSFRDSDGLTWADAAQRVANDQAAFTVTGDWANGEIAEALAAGTVDSMPFPGTNGIFVFTSDTFPMPLGGPNPDETEALLHTMLTREAQEEFSLRKGSIPARLDADLSRLGERARNTQNDFKSAKLPVLATSGLLPPYYPLDAIASLLSRMIASNDDPSQIEEVVDLMRAAEPLLAVWQNRLKQGPGKQ